MTKQTGDNNLEENYEDKQSLGGLKDEKLREKFKNDFFRDVNARRERHMMMNYSYLQYKGILALNEAYGKDYLKSTGLQINVPRTFMTVEMFRDNLATRPLNIGTTSRNKTGHAQKEKSRYMLKGEWDRSKSQNEKNDAEFDALLFGNGYLLSYFEDDTIITDVYSGYDPEGKVQFEKDELTRYKGMKVRRPNPYYVFPDKDATTNTPGHPGSWGHCYLYSVWDFDAWEDECEKRGFNTDGMVTGGHLEEFDEVRRRIDSIYSNFRGIYDNSGRTDDGQLASNNSSKQKMDKRNKIMVVERFEPENYTVMSGGNWTKNYSGVNPDPDKIIPIGVIRDIRVPDEFDGVGEPEIMRWQQYEENKVHNLSYMQILLNTVQRYGIVPEYLMDPTEAKSSNPLKPIRVKNIPGIKVNDAIQALNQGRGTQYPQDFLKEIKDTGQGATGATDYMSGANDSDVNTLGEAEMMKGAGNTRIIAKIQSMEERDLVPILEHWLACFPQYYTEEMDLKLNDGQKEEFYVKFLPYIRKFNTHTPTVSKLAIANQQYQAQTLEEIYIGLGYRDVVFVDDVIGDYDVIIKTSSYGAEMNQMLAEFGKAVELMMGANAFNMSIGKPPEWDISKLSEEMLLQFPQIIKNTDDYKMDINQMPELPQSTVEGDVVEETAGFPTGEQPANLLI